MNIQQTLNTATQKLKAQHDSAALDAKVLLAYVLHCNTAYLYSHPEQQLTSDQQQQFEDLLRQRQQGQPIAYLTGIQEFWSLDLQVTPDVLIPRPETELLVETVLQHYAKDKPIQLIDLGTGSGAIAIALATERPDWQIAATDASTTALKIAKSNAGAHHCNNIRFWQGDWCHALPEDIKADCIVSNPPYIGEQEPELQQGDVRFEPRAALVSADQGLADITKITAQAKRHLKPGGLLLFEHGYQQADAVADILEQHGFEDIQHRQDLAGHPRITFGKLLA